MRDSEIFILIIVALFEFISEIGALECKNI